MTHQLLCAELTPRRVLRDEKRARAGPTGAVPVGAQPRTRRHPQSLGHWSKGYFLKKDTSVLTKERIYWKCGLVKRINGFKGQTVSLTKSFSCHLRNEFL